jgi:hypothetical protein
MHRFGHLHGELARRHEHERERRLRVAILGEPLEERERERRRLSGSGRGLAEQVAALEQRRDRLALDRRRLLVAEARERRQQLLRQSEIRESRLLVARTSSVPSNTSTSETSNVPPPRSITIKTRSRSASCKP